MSSYWDNVPRGIWTVVDMIDILNALDDPETTWDYDSRSGRLDVFGISKKALIVDLPNIKESADSLEYEYFIKEINKLTKLDIPI